MKKNLSKPGLPVKSPPEISIEWMDVAIDIKVCGADIPPEDRGFVRLFPQLDPRLLSSDVLDERRARLKEKKKLERPKYKEYEYVQKKEEPKEKVAPKVLPKLTCNHCGKSFSRKSTLDQHMVTHSSTKNNESWEDVQDAAVKDMECAIAFSSMSGEASFVTLSGPAGEEEEEISPPADIKEGKDEAKQQSAKSDDEEQHECPQCDKSFRKVSLLHCHMKLHSCVKPFFCNVCGLRFLQRDDLNKHMMTHGSSKPKQCVECTDFFPDESQLRYHLMKKHNQTPDQEQPTPLSTTVNTMPKATARKSQLSGPTSNYRTKQSNNLPFSPQNMVMHKEGDKISNSEMKLDGLAFPCPYCDKTFAVKTDMEKHLPFHRKLEKPYSCVVCGWRFHLLNNMQRHMMTHTALDKNRKDLKTEEN